MSDEVPFGRVKDPQGDALRARLKVAIDADEVLTKWEIEFCESQLTRLNRIGAGFSMSEKQEDVWIKIVRKLEQEELL